MQHTTPQNDSSNTPGNLRKGWTTGACATAAAKAAYLSLISGQEVAKVSITLPRGQQVEFTIERVKKIDKFTAQASVIKDAGDDPDVTHGAEIIAIVKLINDDEIRFKAGKGVGTVTRPGLKLAVGEPAINPVPRQMLTYTIGELAQEYGQPGHVEITLSIPNGEDLAQRTLNARLGIEGGLSILGTTGIVKPYSCSAWIDSIHRGIDVAKACHIKHVAACTGSTSEKAVQRYLGLDDVAMLEMGDFVGAILKYIKKNTLPRLTIGGGFAKISKLAMGHINLHSKRSVIDFDWMAEQISVVGAHSDLIETARRANTALEVLNHAEQANLELAQHIARLAQKKVSEQLGNEIEVSIIIVSHEGKIIGKIGV